MVSIIQSHTKADEDVMVDVIDIQAQMADKIARLAQGDGLTPSTVSGVKILYSTVHQPRTPVMYTPVW